MALWLKVHCQAYNSLVTTFYITLWIWLGTVIQYSYIDLYSHININNIQKELQSVRVYIKLCQVFFTCVTVDLTIVKLGNMHDYHTRLSSY